jgi:hypothetical protein
MTHRGRRLGPVAPAIASAALIIMCFADRAAADSAVERSIREALAKPTKLEFNETRLEDALKYISSVHKIPIEPKHGAIMETGATLDSPITRSCDSGSLASALNLICSDLGLTYIVENDALIITTPERAQRTSMPRVHDVGGLAGEADRETLIQTVEMVLDPPAAGGFGAGEGAKESKPAPRIRIFRDKLILRGSQPEHDRVAKFLTELRGAPRATVVEPLPTR